MLCQSGPDNGRQCLKQFRTKKTILWLGLMAYVLAGTGFMGTTVVCYGSDGHFALEASNEGVCSSTLLMMSENISLTEKDLQVIHRHCGSCLDFPLMGGPPDHTVVSVPRFLSQFRVMTLLSPSTVAVSTKTMIRSANISPDLLIRNNDIDAILRTVIIIV